MAHITQPIANFYFVCGTSHTPQPIANFYFVCGTSYTPQPITIFCVWDESHTTANNNFVFVCGTQSHTTANYNFPFCVWDAVTHHSQLQYFVCGTSHTPHVAWGCVCGSVGRLYTKNSYQFCGLPANNRLIKFKMSRLYEEYNKNQLLFTMSQIALFLVNTG